MNIISHNRSNYYGIQEKIDSLPHFLSNIGNIITGVQAAGRANQADAFGTKNQLWQGTPISDFFVGKAYASEGTNNNNNNNNNNTPPPNYSPLNYSPVGNTFSNLNNNTTTTTNNSNGGGGDWGGYGSKNAYFQALGLGEIAPEGWNGPSAGPSAYEIQARNEINSGYDNYFRTLDDILNNSLPGQRTAQENIVGSQYDQGVSRLGAQKQSGLQDLGNEEAKTQSNQARTLKDLADNIRNSFQAGNVYLGAKGAGDSSAANQYAYALTKLGSQQRGDINSQYGDIYGDINQRMTKLGDTYNQAVNDLAFERDQKINSIAQWFGEQQQALKMAQGQGQISRGQDLASLSQNLLNVALQQLQNVQTELSNKRSALEEWAINNSTNIQQLTQNMGAIASAPFAQSPNAQSIVGTPQTGASGGFYAPTGFGSGGSDTDIFGRPIR